MESVRLKKVDQAAILPEYATKGAMAADLAAMEDCVVKAKGRLLVRTGIAIELPEQIAALILSRSGYAIKHGVSVLNSPGLIDSDYRGEIKVILANHTDTDFTVRRGSRVAQMLFVNIEKPWLRISDVLTETERGEGAFGSTGD